MRATSPKRPPLRLLTGELDDQPLRLGEQAPAETVDATVGPALYRRPGERLELISLPEARLEPARRAALGLCICPETAVSLLLERELITAWLAARGLGETVSRLDEAARSARIEIGLWQAHGSYLAHLLGRNPAPLPNRPLASPRVAVPVRLLDRLLAAEPRLDGDPAAEFAAAREWEIAALLAGETMSE